ncbi:MAG: DEAD/DEAH box helicase family protein [Phycisphaerae bacterium]|nr:DEAD/DEAH box helicase family protein [Phycisphaerae bacterium]
MQPSSPRLSFDRGTLRIDGVARSAVQFALACGCDWDPRVDAWRCEAIRASAVERALKATYGADWTNAIEFLRAPALDASRLPSLRPEQTEAVTQWEKAGRRGQVIMPTGTGKTVVALAAIAAARVSTLIVAPIRDLMYQWHRRILKDLGYDAGVIGDNQHVIRPISVTTYDSAYIHMAQLGDRFEFLVFDEEHHLSGACVREAAILSAAPLRLGLTARPWRADGRHTELETLVGPVVYEMPFDAARRNRLADFDVIRIPVALHEEEQETFDRCSRLIRDVIAERRRQNPRFTRDDLCAEASADPEARHAMKAFFAKRAIEDRAHEKFRVLEDLFRLHSGSRVIVFAGSNQMAIDVSQRFLVPSLLAHSPKWERHAVLDGFANGEFPVVVANQVLDEGIDVPDAKIAVVLGGHASTRQALQRLGRILRRVGEARAVPYEVVCETSGETQRSRDRRRNDAYSRTRHRSI